MVALFKDRSPATIFWLLVLSIVVHSHFLIDFPAVNAAAPDGLLTSFLRTYISPLNPVLILVIYHAVVVVQALRLNYLFTDHRMYSRVNYLVAMVYILLTGLFAEWSSLTPALLDNTLIIWLFAKMIRLYNHQNPKTLLFNIGLITGCSILLYHPSALLILVALFALMIVRPFIVTELLVLLMGVAFPLYFLASWLYLTDRLSAIKSYLPDWYFNLPPVHLSALFFITVALIFLILAIGLYYSQQENRRLLIQIRKNWVVLLAMLFVLLPVPFINRGAGVESLILWIIPASPFIAKGFLVPKRPTLPGLMFWSLIVLAILRNWQLLP